uniref:Uncharacterized protein n=1 Tax=Nelumbo nucifera TaxID=4432 RepID=A0A822XRN6_NELNU|nr:TPA_asm: hypothetical protein HUJ06_024553 [Nelumbo nucifera]
MLDLEHLTEEDMLNDPRFQVQSHGSANTPVQGGNNFHPIPEVTPPNLRCELATPPIHSGDNSHPTPEVPSPNLMQEPRAMSSQVPTRGGRRGRRNERERERHSD